jgi:signal transduction histidine kinase
MDIPAAALTGVAAHDVAALGAENAALRAALRTTQDQLAPALAGAPRDDDRRPRLDADAQLRSVESLFMQTPALINIVRGREHRYSFINPPAQKVLGPLAKIGGRASDGLPEFEGSQTEALLDSIRISGRAMSIKEHTATIGTHVRSFDITWAPLQDHDGTVQGIVTFAIEVTEQVAAREALNALVVQLREERVLRERFVAMLTHDLRTPLFAARMGGQLIAKIADAPADILRLAARILNSVNRADQMITDLLDAHRIQGGDHPALEREVCVVNAIITETLDELRIIHGDRFLLVAPTSIQGTWNRKDLRRVIDNLCGNAIKYGDSTGSVTITLGQVGEEAHVDVHNEGNPISAEDRTAMFDQHHRSASATASGQKGWGLGLTAAADIVAAHGGTLSVESSVERGTIFHVVLPIG